MKPFFKKNEGEGMEWLIIYGDMITVILTFFVLLFSISELDKEKYIKIVKALNESFGGSNYIEESGSVSKASKSFASTELVSEITETIYEQNLQDALEISNDNRGVVLHASDEIFFRSGEAEILNQGKTFLIKLSELIKNSPNQIVVEGHTDHIPINTAKYPSNWELSTARASSVVRFLIEEGDISPERITASGYADLKPRFPHFSKNRSKNRRVEIIMLNEK